MQLAVRSCRNEGEHCKRLSTSKSGQGNNVIPACSHGLLAMLDSKNLHNHTKIEKRDGTQHYIVQNPPVGRRIMSCCVRLREHVLINGC
jgi:hypothetical protein